MWIVLKVLVTAFALWVTSLLPGIDVPSDSLARRVLTLVVVAVVFGVINAVLKPIIKVVGCALYVLTLGLITFVVNAALLLLAAWVCGKLGFPFQIDSFWWALAGSVVISVVGFVLHLLIPDRLDERKHA